jgi:hypothetical protein
MHVSVQLLFVVGKKKKRRTTNIRGRKAPSSSVSLDTNVIAHVNHPRDVSTHDSLTPTTNTVCSGRSSYGAIERVVVATTCELAGTFHFITVCLRYCHIDPL